MYYGAVISSDAALTNTNRAVTAYNGHVANCDSAIILVSFARWETNGAAFACAAKL